MAEDSLLVMAPAGDLILSVSQGEGELEFRYRVDSSALKANSRYFENLLSDRFNEGQQLSAALAQLNTEGQSSFAETPIAKLPHISLVNVGRIALSKTSNIQNLVADFLRAVHGLDLAVATPPVPNLANLAVVADRFDAVECLARFVQRKKYLQVLDAKTKGKISSGITEERVRQKLFVGVLFDHASWVTRYSKYLIMKDSSQWQPGVEEDFSKALWWNLPNGLEGLYSRASLISMLIFGR